MNFHGKRNIVFIIIVCCIVIMLIGCSFPGIVFVSFSWEFDIDIENLNWSHNIPKIDTDINLIKEGGYYPTDPGNYTITYNYPDSLALRVLDVPLEADITVLGVENAFYDVIILKNKPPGFYKVPAQP